MKPNIRARTKADRRGFAKGKCMVRPMISLLRPVTPLTQSRIWSYQRRAGIFPVLVICPAGLRRGETSALKRPASGRVLPNPSCSTVGPSLQGP